MRVVFWQNILSPHQSAAIRALAAMESEVVVVASEAMLSERKQIGWSVPDFGRANLVVAPAPEQIRSLITQDLNSTVHIIAGARWTPLGSAATAACIQARARMGIMSEAADAGGLKGQARWLKYAFERVQAGRHFQFILAIGQPGVRWFRLCGYPRQKVFPYAYFTEDPQGPLPLGDANARHGGAVQLIYLGRLVPGKGLELMLRAAAECADLRWGLVIVGDGPLRAALEQMAQSLGLKGKISFIPAMEHAKAMEFLAAKDLLVLPSDGKEGWGAVVNEALMRGVPVICSTRCGAADLLRPPWRGEVFPTRSVPALTEALRRWITRGKKAPETSARIRSWSACIRGEAAARYLSGILEHVYRGGIRPPVPWEGN